MLLPGKIEIHDGFGASTSTTTFDGAAGADCPATSTADHDIPPSTVAASIAPANPVGLAVPPTRVPWAQSFERSAGDHTRIIVSLHFWQTPAVVHVKHVVVLPANTEIRRLSRCRSIAETQCRNSTDAFRTWSDHSRRSSPRPVRGHEHYGAASLTRHRPSYMRSCWRRGLRDALTRCPCRR
jgi:hypothetical protein